MTKKIIISIVAICIIAMGIIASRFITKPEDSNTVTGESNETTNDPEVVTDDPEVTTDEIETITISYDTTTPEITTLEITDKKIIKEILDFYENGEFKNVPKEELLEGVPGITINIPDGTIIEMYDDEDYGEVLFNGEKSGKMYYLPEGLNAYINGLREEKE